ncbi:MAG: 4-hydroxy-tetrahydrodipicolinate reductase [Oceanotoga sp.]|uniref:4-hydroxy-tetrahydrodipicolinate reductase n=1 Tax=Oceanotoga sp. TaxID=2108366 RepID=UPI00264E7517|nr:dihydrodipicolinate reductase C-terminal domain-containing protein [Oceanotoga sp.]MDN5342676.1 4-hydroxy-tetrahydrodipicolinate reductase [Oceanotoga sp.]
MKYGLIGYKGKMGNSIKKLMDEENHQLVYKLDKNIEEEIDIPQLIIDFSNKSLIDKVIEKTQKYKSKLIIGTTALEQKDIEKLKQISQNTAIIQSYNYSIGIQLLIKAAQMINKQTLDWDKEISEIHHRFKVDKPSGTAIMIKNSLDQEINITSKRLGNVFGEHEINFSSLEEIITIKHQALTRDVFARGVLKSVNYIKDKKNGYYTFKNVMEG